MRKERTGRKGFSISRASGNQAAELRRVSFDNETKVQYECSQIRLTRTRLNGWKLSGLQGKVMC